jgi:hypothetical protein
MDNEIKVVILNRLFEAAGVCSVCGRVNCNHGNNKELPSRIDIDDVLRAINVDEYFFNETV